MGEIEALRALVTRLEEKLDLLDRRQQAILKLADRVDDTQHASRLFEEHVVMPMLLRLAGFGHRVEMAELLAELEARVQASEDANPDLEMELRRVRYWRDQLAAMPTWLGYPPSGYYPDDDGEDKPVG